MTISEPLNASGTEAGCQSTQSHDHFPSSKEGKKARDGMNDQ